MKIGCDVTQRPRRQDDRAVELFNHCWSGELRACDERVALVNGRFYIVRALRKIHGQASQVFLQHCWPANMPPARRSRIKPTMLTLSSQ